MADSGKTKKWKGCLPSFGIAIVIIAFFCIAFIVFLLGGWIYFTKKQDEANRIQHRINETEDAKEKVGKFETAVLKYYKKECRFPKSAVSVHEKVKPDFSGGGFGELELDDIHLFLVYFQYRLVNEDKRLTIIAENDYFPEISKNTTHTLVLNAGPDCTVISEPIVTILEKESN